MHLSGRDIDNALLKLNSIEVKGKTEEEEFNLVVCPRYKQKNSPLANFCNSCGLTLDQSYVMKLDERQDKTNQLFDILIKQLETLDHILDSLQSLNAERQQ